MYSDELRKALECAKVAVIEYEEHYVKFSVRGTKGVMSVVTLIRRGCEKEFSDHIYNVWGPVYKRSIGTIVDIYYDEISSEEYERA